MFNSPLDTISSSEVEASSVELSQVRVSNHTSQAIEYFWYEHATLHEISTYLPANAIPLPVFR